MSQSKKGSKGVHSDFGEFQKVRRQTFGSQIWGSRRVGKGGVVEGGGELNKNKGTTEFVRRCPSTPFLTSSLASSNLSREEHGSFERRPSLGAALTNG